MLEALKARYNQGLDSNLNFYRDSHGKEIDLLHATGRDLIAAEIKSASTFNSSFKKNLLNFAKKQAPLKNGYVIYNDDTIEFSDGIQAIGFREVSGIVE